MSERTRTVRFVAGPALVAGALALFTGVVTLVSPTVTLVVAVVDLVLGVGLLVSLWRIVPSTPTETR